FSTDTKYFTPNDKNTIGATFSGILLINRLIWIAIGFVILFLSYFSFSFIAKNKKVKKQQLEDANTLYSNLEAAIKGTPVFNLGTSISQFKSFFKLNFYSIVKSTLFKILFVVCALMLISNLWGGFDYMGLQSYPVTYKMMETVNGISAFFVLIILVFFSGELVWRDRDSHLHEVIDATPHNSTISLFAKTLSLISVGTILNLFFIGGAILYQLANGYTKIELGLYAQDFLFTAFPMYIIWSCILVFVQIMINNKYLGYFVSILLIFLLDILFLIMEVESNMLSIGSGPSYTYSDMNGFAPFITRLITYKLYWISFCALIIIISNLFWVRGSSDNFMSRFQLAKTRMNNYYIAGIASSLAVFILLGSFIFYNTNVLNDYHQPKYYEKLSADYEKKYKKYKSKVFPKITAVNGEVHLFPKTSEVKFNGTYILQNKTEYAVDTIHSNFNTKFPYKTFEWSVKNKLVARDSTYGWDIYAFDPPIAPGDEISLTFSGNQKRLGFNNSGVDMTVIENGTMIFSSQLLPTFGYNSDRELSQKRTRKKYGLNKEKDPMKPFNDIEGLKNGILGDDADWVNYEMIMSTDVDQIAITPGYLINEWEEKDRKYFHYKMDKPIHNLFAFVSGKYESFEETWNGVKLEILYHPKHNYNLKTMMDGMKKS
ncbi:MAG: hypothetical protein P8L91_01715, partial [Candidatus Marinimicrobia bacterium]|nr:hypothetical protein [Candidatus Neomarinimicrobiota bacterium]